MSSGRSLVIALVMVALGACAAPSTRTQPTAVIEPPIRPAGETRAVYGPAVETPYTRQLKQRLEGSTGEDGDETISEAEWKKRRRKEEVDSVRETVDRLY